MSVKDVMLGLVFWRVKPRAGTDEARGEKAKEWSPPPPVASSKTSAKGWPRGWRGALRLVKDAFSEWSDDQAPRLGAALSYYTIFALAPVLLLAISVAGLVFGQEAAQGQILGELRTMFGPETALMVQEMLAKSAKREAGVIGTVVGLGTLLVGATAVMIELESALDAVWKVKARPGRGILGALKDRLLSLGLILSLGFLLIVSLVASAVLSALGGLLERMSFPGANIVGQLLQNLVTFGVIGLFFALIFKYLPNTRIAWRDLWVGALVTSFLFHLGKILIGIYLGQATVASTFGAAGSLAVLLVWVYYTAQIVIYGAEVTRLYAERYGSGITPDNDAVPAPRAIDCATGGAGQTAPQT